MQEKIKRQLKNKLNTKGRTLSIPLLLLVISISMFLSTQLYMNSKLSPLGVQLQSYNTEKDLLLEENREIEKDLANAQSITVVQNLTNKQFKLKPTKASQLVYVTGNLNASR